MSAPEHDSFFRCWIGDSSDRGGGDFVEAADALSAAVKYVGALELGSDSVEVNVRRCPCSRDPRWWQVEVSRVCTWQAQIKARTYPVGRSR